VVGNDDVLAFKAKSSSERLRQHPAIGSSRLNTAAALQSTASQGEPMSMNDKIKHKIDTAADKAKDSVDRIADHATDSRTAAADKVKDASRSTGDKIKDAARNVGNAVKDAGHAAGNAVKDAGRKIKGKID
jgi:gas vesicle protein